MPGSYRSWWRYWGTDTKRGRAHLLKRMRDRGGLIAQPLVAEAVGNVLADDSNVQVRLQAALTLGDFTEVDGVLSRLTATALAQNESIDLRYAAFTSVERHDYNSTGLHRADAADCD